VRVRWIGEEEWLVWWGRCVSFGCLIDAGGYSQRDLSGA
jgi:hypothetical protein